MALLVAGLLIGGCSSGPAEPEPLDPQEIRLVEEVLTLMELRVERVRDPEGAEERREQLGELYTQEQVDALLDGLAADPRRAHLFAEAIQESLKARRLRLFPPTVVGGGESPRVPGSTDESSDPNG